MIACGTAWCVALAAPDGVHCSVHRTNPSLRLVSGEFADEGVDPGCSECDGTGECSECNGDMTCSCHCGDEHDCHHCDGSGACPECKRTMPKRDKWAEEYLRFAFDIGPQPFDPVAAYEALS